VAESVIGSSSADSPSISSSESQPIKGLLSSLIDRSRGVLDAHIPFFDRSS
jgi:hypothetical protein